MSVPAGSIVKPMIRNPDTETVQAIARGFDCDDAVAQSLARQAQRVSFEPRDIVLASGERPEHLFLMIRGHARMLAISIDGRMAVIEEFRDGDLFGEGALTDEGPGAETGDEVVAVSHSTACSLESHVMVAAMSAHASVAMAISRRLLKRLMTQNRRMAEVSTLSTVGRINAELLRLARGGVNLTISPPPVLTQFALSLQTTRETVSRAISKLEKKGILKREENGLRIVAEHRLEELIF